MDHVESGIPETAAFLATKITGLDRGEEGDWYQIVENILSEQSKETLEALVAESTEFNQYHWGAMDNSISDFVYGGPVADSYFGEEKVDLPGEFFLRLAFNLIQLVVEEHLPMLSASPRLNWNGEYDEPDVDDMNQSISNVINYLALEMVVGENELKLARGIHLCKTFTNYDEQHLTDETLLWMSENAMVVLANAIKVFNGEVFDLDLAKEIVRVKTPVLREGVL